MSLWGAYESDESKPKYLTDAEKKNCYATQAGWVYKHPDGSEEVLVAIGDLAGTDAGATHLGEATISSLEWVTTTLADGDTVITAKVIYNEKVTVDTSGGTPSITVTNGNESSAGNGDYTLSYSAGTGTNQLTFTATGLTISATDVLTIAAQNVALNSGTITDTADGTTASGVAISAAAAATISSITVTA